jgi:hypothetical protein
MQNTLSLLPKHAKWESWFLSSQKPLAVRHLQILPQIFRIDLPEDLIQAVEGCKTNADIKRVGIEWAIQQSLELKAAGVPVLHYYSMGKSENIKQIARIFLVDDLNSLTTLFNTVSGLGSILKKILKVYI